jgi:uncharacterized protein DUF3455
MQFINIKLIVGLVVALGIAGSALALQPNISEDAPLPPELPPACGTLRVEQGNEVAFHVYAIGVQIYRWTGTAWVLFAPDANLYADANYRGKVGTHYGGPTWESNSGSNVIGTRVNGCDLDPANTIPWLLLKKVSSEGPGVFNNVTFIQRVNTTGGVKPSAPGLTIGEEKRVPYTAEYYFYRAAD